MRALLVLFAIALSLNAYATKKASRAPSTRAPNKFFTFSCHDEQSESENVVGIVSVAMGGRQSETGPAEATIHLRKNNGYETKALTGRYSAVPRGFVFQAKSGATNYEINVHPAEQTTLPDLPKQTCVVTAHLGKGN